MGYKCRGGASYGSVHLKNCNTTTLTRDVVAVRQHHNHNDGYDAISKVSVRNVNSNISNRNEILLADVCLAGGIM